MADKDNKKKNRTPMDPLVDTLSKPSSDESMGGSLYNMVKHRRDTEKAFAETDPNYKLNPTGRAGSKK